MSSGSAAVTLRLFGPLRNAVGQREVQLPCAGATVTETLARLAKEWGDSVRPFIFDRQGNQMRSLILLVNDEPVEDSKLTVVHGGDVVSVLLPLAGG
ncbi:MAG: MoaD/ThiS family protein [Armatimonadota bacterium]